MTNNNSCTSAATGLVPGRVTFLDGQNELPMMEVSTAFSSAEIYTHGAQVTRFKKKGEEALLFMSQCSRFSDGQPIRGGVPIILPWFGMREGLGQHGFARLKEWELKEVVPGKDGSVSLGFRLPECPEASGFPPFCAEYFVTVSDSLKLELAVTNRADRALAYEECLHTYFEVGDASQISVSGLQGAEYLDKVANFARKKETEQVIRIASEVDRTYVNTTSTVEILDPVFGRRIIVEKENSRSTVVWNPWVERAQQMLDFGNEEYKQMVCVESGNVGENEITLQPGESSKLVVRLSSRPL